MKSVATYNGHIRTICYIYKPYVVLHMLPPFYILFYNTLDFYFCSYKGHIRTVCSRYEQYVAHTSNMWHIQTICGIYEQYVAICMSQASKPKLPTLYTYPPKTYVVRIWTVCSTYGLFAVDTNHLRHIRIVCGLLNRENLLFPVA